MTALQVHSWPSAIAHVDGNAFFASVMQAAHLHLQNKPVVIGKERGIVTAVSYEAKKYGITRGMRGFEIKRLCPAVLFLEGDYELFSLFSQRMFSILRQFSPVVEEYSVDEGFLDLFGMRAHLHMTYHEIAVEIQKTIHNQLGIPVSVGVSLTKSLAKLASGSKKPQGITLVAGRDIEQFLKDIPIENVWGIGPATASFLRKNNIRTAGSFAEKRVAQTLSKPYYAIWNELRGIVVHGLDTNKKITYQSIGKTHTFTTPSHNKTYVWAQLRHNIEEAFAKARKYHYCVKEMAIFIKTQGFQYRTKEIYFDTPQQYPLVQIKYIQKMFSSIYTPSLLYRASGCTLTKLISGRSIQGSLFTSDTLPKQHAKTLYNIIGKQNLTFGTSLWISNKRGEKREEHMPRLSLPTLHIDRLV